MFAARGIWLIWEKKGYFSSRIFGEHDSSKNKTIIAWIIHTSVGRALKALKNEWWIVVEVISKCNGKTGSSRTWYLEIIDIQIMWQAWRKLSNFHLESLNFPINRPYKIEIQNEITKEVLSFEKKLASYTDCNRVICIITKQIIVKISDFIFKVKVAKKRKVTQQSYLRAVHYRKEIQKKKHKYYFNKRV